MGIDTSYINAWADVSLGHAAGQTFLAIDTMIASITLWRNEGFGDDISVWHIFIMELDSFGVPDTHHIIQDGPTLMIEHDDGVHPTEFKFVFDPPVVLPHPGEYELAVMGDHCVGYFPVAANWPGGSAYPDGQHWDHPRQAFSCSGHPGPDPIGHPDSDLVFRVEFCATMSPATPSSWGRIKALYR